MKIIIMVFLIVITIITTGYRVHANEDLSGQEILATAKVTGACGILDSIIQFQKTTKMEGGDAFVARFWSVEAARRGMTVQEMSEQCDKAVALYDKLWRATESKTK